jgi:hypothetical protein
MVVNLEEREKLNDRKIWKEWKTEKEKDIKVKTESEKNEINN